MEKSKKKKKVYMELDDWALIYFPKKINRENKVKKIHLQNTFQKKKSVFVCEKKNTFKDIVS